MDLPFLKKEEHGIKILNKSAQTTRPLLKSSLSIPSFEKIPFNNVKITKNNSRKNSFKSSFAVPNEDEELIPNTTTVRTNNICQNDTAVTTPIEEDGNNPKCEMGKLEDKLENSGTHFGKSLLTKAILEGNMASVEARITAGDDVNAEDEEGWLPMHYACKKGATDIIKLLLQKGCDVTSANADRVTCLHVAVRSGKEDVVTLLLDAGSVPDVREKNNGRTAVHETILLANTRVLQIIVKKLQNEPWESQRILRIADKDGRTSMHIAADKCLSEAITLLLEAGADVAALDNEGMTPMHVTLLSHWGKRRCGGVLTQLLEAGGQVEIEGGPEGEKLSHFAAKVGCSNCLQFLHTRGANLEAKDKLGRTPLHAAASEEQVESATYLISKGVNLECQDNNGLRPLHMALMSDSAKIIEILVASGATTFPVDNDGRTYVQVAILRRKYQAFQALVRSRAANLPEGAGEDVLHYCAALGFINSVLFLLDEGWDINLRDSKGRTALHRSLNHGHEQLATTLINREASLDATDNTGATPLHYAVRWGGSDAILRLLVKKKAKLGVCDRLGRTPLHYAASKFSIMSDLCILLNVGSACDTQDKMGLTPLHLAARLGNESLVRLLLDNGAKHDLKDLYDFLPIDHAIEKNNKSIIKRLQNHHRKLHPEDKSEHGTIRNMENSSNDAPKESRLEHRKSVAW